MKGPFEIVSPMQPAGGTTQGAASVLGFQSDTLLLNASTVPTVFDGIEASGRVLTLEGELEAGDLQAGDFVMGTDGQYHEIIWGYRENRTSDELADFTSRRSILITAHALGAGQPARDITVGPDHLVSIASDRALQLFGERRVLVAASELLILDGVYQAPPVDTAVMHLVFDTATTLLVNGLGVTGCCMTDRRHDALSDIAQAAMADDAPRLALTAGRICQEPQGVFMDKRELTQVFPAAVRHENAADDVVTPLRLKVVEA